MNEAGYLLIARRAKAKYVQTMTEARSQLTAKLNELKRAEKVAEREFEEINKKARDLEKQECMAAMKQYWTVPQKKQRGSR